MFSVKTHYTRQNCPGFDFIFASSEEILKLKSFESGGDNFSKSTGKRNRKTLISVKKSVLHRWQIISSIGSTPLSSIREAHQGTVPLDCLKCCVEAK